MKMNVYEKLAKAKEIFHNEQITKSKTNTFAKFKYMELSDIIPVLDRVEKELKVVVMTTFTNELVTTKFINIEEPSEVIEFTSSYNIDLETGQIKGVQKVGAQHTYFRRYMLMLVFEIIENDAVEEQTGKPQTQKAQKAPKKPQNNAVKEEFKQLANEYSTRNNVTLKDIFSEFNITGNSTDEEIAQATMTLKQVLF